MSWETYGVTQTCVESPLGHRDRAVWPAEFARSIWVKSFSVGLVNPNETPNLDASSVSRRHFLKLSGGTAAWSLALNPQHLFAAEQVKDGARGEYLRSIAPTSQRVLQFTELMTAAESVRRSNGWTYHAELGWIHCDAVHDNGVDGARTFYSYEPDGARRVIQGANQACRIHAYGNSFTHCDQVSDGETWEEYLAGRSRKSIAHSMAPLMIS